MPPTTPKVNTGNDVNATMNKMVGVPPSSHRTTEVMYVTHGVTRIRISTGCVASSTNRDDAINDPTAIAHTMAIDRPRIMCQPVVTAFDQ